MKKYIYILLTIILIATTITSAYLYFVKNNEEVREQTYRDNGDDWPDDSFMKTVSGNPEDFGIVRSEAGNFAYVDSGLTSATSSKITFTGYSSVVKDLPPQKTIEKFIAELSKGDNEEIAENVLGMINNILSEKENMDMDIFTRFLNVNEYVESVEVLEDGTKLVYMCALGRNHPCYVGFYIIKNDKIVFSINGEVEEVVPTKDGFSVSWIPYNEKPFSDFPMCCKPGYRTTYFNYKFEPVGETETIFTKVIIN